MRTGLLLRLGFAFLVGSLLLPAGASAQSAFSGVVRDSSGGVLPGVAVEASSPALIEKTRSVVTDAEGRYTIVDLRPGTYKLSFTLAGFETVVRDAIELGGNITVPINIELKVGALEETLTVSGQTPLVDVQNAQRTQVLDRAVEDALPSTRNMQTVGAPIVGVKLSRPDVGGSQNMEQAYMRTHGADDRHTSMQVDGMNVNSSMGDGNIQAYNDDALAAQIVFQTSALPAEVAAGGVRVNMIPKDGGNQFRGGGFFGGTEGGWQSNNDNAALEARNFPYPNFVHQIQDFNGNFGGPIVHDKLWFFTTARHVSVDEGVANSPYLAPYEGHKAGDPAVEFQYVRDVMVRLTYQMSSRNKFSVYLERIWKHKDPELSPGYDPNTASDIRDPLHALYYVGQAKYTSPITSKLLYEFGYSTNLERLSTAYQPGIAQPPFSPLWYSMVPHVDLVTGTVQGAAPGGWAGTYPDRKIFSTALSYVSGSHALKTGVQWSFGVDGNSNVRNGDLNQEYSNGAPFAVVVYNTPQVNADYVNADLGVYAQDTWTLKRLTLSPGIRFDHFNVTAQEGCRGAGRFVGAECLPAVPDQPDWNNVSPRFAAVYDLKGDAKTAIKASVSKYMLPWAGGWAKRYDPFTLQSDTRTWSDPNGCYSCFGPDGVAGIPAGSVIGPSGNSNFGVTTGRAPAPGLAREYNIEETVGVQHQLLPRVSVFGGYFHRHFYNQEAQVNPLLTMADFTPFQVANPLNNGEMITLFNLNPAKAGAYASNLIDINSPINRTIYDGFEASFTARLPRGANVFGGWSNDRYITVSCDQYDPNKLRFCDQTGQTFQQYGVTARPPFTNDFKLSANYPLPWGIEVSANVMSLAGKGNSYTGSDPSLGVYWSVPASVFPNGQRTRVVVSSPVLLTAGTQTQAPGVDLISPGTRYEPRWNQTDLAFKKTFRFPGGRTVQGQAAIFNIFNGSAVIQENQSFGPSLGQPQDILQARLLRLALLINF
jgi:hypothetical protein